MQYAQRTSWLTELDYDRSWSLVTRARNGYPPITEDEFVLAVQTLRACNRLWRQPLTKQAKKFMRTRLDTAARELAASLYVQENPLYTRGRIPDRYWTRAREIVYTTALWTALRTQAYPFRIEPAELHPIEERPLWIQHYDNNGVRLDPPKVWRRQQQPPFRPTRPPRIGAENPGLAVPGHQDGDFPRYPRRRSQFEKGELKSTRARLREEYEDGLLPGFSSYEEEQRLRLAHKRGDLLSLDAMEAPEDTSLEAIDRLTPSAEEQVETKLRAEFVLARLTSEERLWLTARQYASTDDLDRANGRKRDQRLRQKIERLEERFDVTNDP